jgi:hypothetical protein
LLVYAGVSSTRATAYVVLGRRAGVLDLRRPGGAAMVIRGPRHSPLGFGAEGSNFAGIGDVDGDGFNDSPWGTSGIPRAAAARRSVTAVCG